MIDSIRVKKEGRAQGGGLLELAGHGPGREGKVG